MSIIDKTQPGDAFLGYQRTEPLTALASFQKAMGDGVVCTVRQDSKHIMFYTNGFGGAFITHRDAGWYTPEALGYFAGQVAKQKVNGSF